MNHHTFDTSSILLRDGENRMRGISDNGYMSLYWYDADGNRTVKRHNGGDAFHLYLPITRSEEDKDNDAAADASDGGQRNHPNTLGDGKVYFYHRDHLGSTMSVTDSVGNYTQIVEYTPWGEVFVEQRNDSICTTPYLFNGKELDEETGLYYYGARYYHPKMSVWYSTDPMEMEYSWVTTYGYCMNNPVINIDPNGRENIVVVGSNNNNAKGSKLMFINQGIAQIQHNYEKYGKESNTMVLFKEGYTQRQINETKNAIAEYGANLIIVNSAKEFIDYINTGGNRRQNDLITNVTIFSHGKPGSIEFGYSFDDKTVLSYKLDKSNVSQFNPTAFKGKKSSITSYACRSGLGPNYGILDFDTENSIAQQMANSTGAIVGAFLVKTDYSNTLGTVFQRRFGNASLQYKLVDNAILTPHGALNPVHGGSTPWFYSSSQKVFTLKDK